MTEQDQDKQTETRPVIPQQTGDCVMAGVSFMLALPPLAMSGLVFVIPRPWSIVALVASLLLAMSGLVTGVIGLRQIADAEGKLRGRGMAMAAVGMGALGIIGLIVAGIFLMRMAG